MAVPRVKRFSGRRRFAWVAALGERMVHRQGNNCSHGWSAAQPAGSGPARDFAPAGATGALSPFSGNGMKIFPGRRAVFVALKQHKTSQEPALQGR